MKEVKVEKLDHNSMKPFGKLIIPRNNKPPVIEADYDLWPGVDDIVVEKEDRPQLALFSVKHERPFSCGNMERHINCSETLIPVEGESIVVFALSGPDNLPDLNTAKAFYLNRSTMLNINPGVWHWIPFPLKDKADFMVILSKKAFDGKDIEVIDLKETLKISLKN